MVKKYRIAGLVSYRTDKGMRLSIPVGQLVEVEERDFEENGNLFAARMTWTDAAGSIWIEKWTSSFWNQLVRTQLEAA